MNARRYYAGIGSRETPYTMLALFRRLGLELAQAKLVLRSGAADGADTAFEQGCDVGLGEKQIFLPWPGFQGRGPVHGKVFAGVGPRALELAAQYHPAWRKCSTGAKALHARNGYQVLGPKLDEPVLFVVCWTRGGDGLGGTGQALRIAREHQIPIFDFGAVSHPADRAAMLDEIANLAG